MSETRPGYGSSRDDAPNDVDAIGLALKHTWYTLTRSSITPEHPDALGKQAYWVLFATTEAPRRMADLAEVAEVSSASLTGIVDRLEERGLIERLRSDDDRRVVMAKITEAGLERVRTARDEFRERLNGLLGTLDDDERTELVRLLTKMTQQKGV